MNTKPYSYVRQNLASVLDEVCESRSPITITRQGGKEVVMMSREEYEALEETFHLVRSPKNLARLRASIAEANAGKAKVRKGFKG
jgi:antitoxin YefM